MLADARTLLAQVADPRAGDRRDDLRGKNDGCSARAGSLDNIDRYVDADCSQHLVLVARVGRRSASSIAFALAILSHRRRWLIPASSATTGILYTIPSIAFFLLLLPITGRGTDDGDHRAHRSTPSRSSTATPTPASPTCPASATRRRHAAWG